MIGRVYIARDNSYLLNLTDPIKDFRLAGTFRWSDYEVERVNPPIPAIIVSEPYW